MPCRPTAGSCGVEHLPLIVSDRHGFLDILYTPLAMIAQVVLILPIGVRSRASYWNHCSRICGLSSWLSSWRRMVVLLQDAKAGLVTIALVPGVPYLVGAIIIVGGNINHVTRMTTAIALKPHAGIGAGHGLGIILRQYRL